MEEDTLKLYKDYQRDIGEEIISKLIELNKKIEQAMIQCSANEKKL